jgi:hypothetical protein
MRILSVAVATALVVGAAPSEAQLIMGAKGGMNLATMSVSGVSPGTRTAFHGAAVIGMGVAPGFTIEGQMRFAGKGFEPGDSGSGVSGNLDMEYFEFPILATMTLPREPSLLAGRIFAGPSVGLRASCNLETPGDQTGFTDCDGDLSKTFDFGITGGVGLKIGRGKGGIILDVSYDLGLLDITSSGSQASARSRNLLFSVGAIVPII